MPTEYFCSSSFLKWLSTWMKYTGLSWSRAVTQTMCLFIPRRVTVIVTVLRSSVARCNWPPSIAFGHFVDTKGFNVALVALCFNHRRYRSPFCLSMKAKSGLKTLVRFPGRFWSNSFSQGSSRDHGTFRGQDLRPVSSFHWEMETESCFILSRQTMYFTLFRAVVP